MDQELEMQQEQEPKPPVSDEEPPAAPQGEQDPAAAKTGKPKLSPKAAEAYQRIVVAAMTVLYKAETRAAVLKMIEQTDPVTGIVKATKFVLDGLAEKSKGLNPKAIYQTAPVVALLIGEIGVKAGVVPDDIQALAPQVLAGLKAELQGVLGGQQRAQPGPAAPPAEQPAPGIVASAMEA